MVATAYTVEIIWWCVVLGALLIPLYSSQWLALRFTPPKKRLPLKVSMLSLGSVCVAALVVRANDPSSVFGRLSLSTNALFAAQSSAMLIFCGSNWLVANARSLYKQINEPMPRFIAPLLYGSGIVFQLTHSIVIFVQGQMMARPNEHSEWSVVRLSIVLDLVLDVEVMILLVTSWVLYVPLRGRIASFVAKLALQEEARVKQLAQNAATAAAAATATTPPPIAPKARLALPADSVDVSVSSAQHQQQRQLQAEIVRPLVVQVVVMGAADTPTRGATPTLPSSAQHATGLRSNPLSPSPSPVTAAAATAQPSIAVVSSVGGSAAQDRLDELRGGMRKLIIMTVLVSIVCLGTGLNTITRLSRTLRGEVVRADLDGEDPESYSTARLIPMLLHLLGCFVTVWYVWSPISVWASARVRRERHTPFWHTIRHGPPAEAMSRYHAETRKTHPREGGGANPAAPEPSIHAAISKVTQTKRNSGESVHAPPAAPKQAW